MRYITESELRRAFAGGAPSHYEIPSDAMLTPSARQYLMDLKLFQTGERPLTNGQPTGRSKPEHMTHLNAKELVCKTHPRILLRGKLDSLESEILVLQCTCPAEYRAPLNDALLLVRRILAADVKDTALGVWTLGGMNAEEVHRQSHHPEEFGLSGHIIPSSEHGLFAMQLNKLRTSVRETELAAVHAYFDADRLRHEDLVLALNRLSSYFYVLQLRASR